MNRLKSVSLVLLSIWWAWTVLVDFVIVKTVFATIDDFFLAGALGISLFSKLNSFELVVASALVSVTALRKAAWKELIIVLTLWSLAMIYFCYLTPKIIFLTDLWKELDHMGIHSTVEIPDIQQEHQFYHRIYIALDTVKLLVLSSLICFGIWKEKN